MAGGAHGSDEGVVARIVRLLSAFDDDEPELGIERLANAAGLPRSTAHRLATELARHGLLAKTAPGVFCVGTRL